MEQAQAVLAGELGAPYVEGLGVEVLERLNRAILGFQEAAKLLGVARAADRAELFRGLVAEADEAVEAAAGALSDVACWTGVVLLRD